MEFNEIKFRRIRKGQIFTGGLIKVLYSENSSKFVCSMWLDLKRN